MPIRAVILDFDGVIYGSGTLQGAGKRVVEIVKTWGYKIPGDVYEKLKNNWGTDGIKMIEICFCLDSEVAKEIYLEWERIDKTELYPLIRNSKEVIKKLRLQQMKVLLLTNRQRKNLMGLLGQFGLVELFDFIQAKDDWTFSKPNPHTFCFILHQLVKSGIHSEECIYVGDTILDFECTTARGLISVSVTTGVFNESDFIKAGQKKENIIRSIAELPEWIEKYNRV
ncbi:MAG: HAD family hydrolase [Candidatus Yanofskybacteria bacterium]|nr:HAD family hydrolase [Candidatus Yanofskybacteria bacterium]